MPRPFHFISKGVLALLVCAALPCATAGAAAAASPIEGVWSFNGGAVDITSQSNGTFVGIVTVQTKFAKCFHPVEEKMWVEITPQPDGSYWGFHHWFFEPTAESPNCVANPTLGPTAWRVLTNANGERYLRVCFSEPNSNSQPTIAPDGTPSNVTYGCVDSAALATLPTVSSSGGSTSTGQISFKGSVKLPATHLCVAHRTLKIKLHDPKYDPLTEVVVRIKGRKVADVHGASKLAHGIVLKRLPQGSYVVKVLATTVLGQHLSGQARYSSCAKGSNGISLHGAKHRHKKK